MKKLKIQLRARCVTCGHIKIITEKVTEQPLCNRCFSPMVLMDVQTKEE